MKSARITILLHNEIHRDNLTWWVCQITRFGHSLIPHVRHSVFTRAPHYDRLFFQMVYTMMWLTWPCFRALGGLSYNSSIGNFQRLQIWQYSSTGAPELKALPGHMAQAAGLFASQTESVAKLSYSGPQPKLETL